jgi:ATP-binding cassette subfamily C protein
VRLLLGFEKPTSGTIYYDKQDIADLDVNALRRQFGVVLQSGQLMPADIFNNIVGTTNLTLDQAWEAARMVGLDEDIKKMPMGMFTVISDGASTLSGGQRQRIMIARAIVHRPRVLFFDEATSALDNHTQAIVTASLNQMKSTRIVIAHRLSTVIKADRIIVLQDGRIVQDGNYQELIAVPGLFKDLATRQIA